MPGGRWLVVRTVSPTDVAGLTELFKGLSEEDLYRRFFQAHVPPSASIEHMAGASERGDIGLVVELHNPDGTRAIVGEAACAMLPDGDGELALTVAPSVRGWTGPYLLALLCDEAAERGVPNIEADVLLDNGPMLALARSRGYATMDHSDCPSVVRVVFNTVGRVPTWPTTYDRPRVVVEAPGGRWHAEEAARASGVHVLVCPGPAAPWCRCPAVAGWRCPLVSSADLVIDAIDPETSRLGRELLGAHESLHGGVPLYVERRRVGHAGSQSGSQTVRRSPGEAAEQAAVIHTVHRMLSPERRSRRAVVGRSSVTPASTQ